MERCIVCGKEIEKDKTACEDCLSFLIWKHKDKFAERIVNFREFHKKRFNSRSNKCRRLNK